ncbi:MAG: AmmeMemoRadiSam system protein A [Anaerolineales bacterium]|nr:AmmeMemoRadiSam system protein A [Anaerolineales bacterium]
MQSSFSAADQAILLSLAYDSVCAAAQNAPLPSIDIDSLPERLRERKASFVTITSKGELRGCIGTIEKLYPLAQDVVIRAASAATKDPRFTPIQVDELSSISIEVSVLSTPRPLEYQDPPSLPALLKPGVDGVILRHGSRRATFLPQVWERVPDADQFLALLCQKALLPEDAWKSGDLLFETYQVESFHR